MITPEYPVRYAAYDNPGKMVRYQYALERRGGLEVACFHYPMKNPHWENLWSGYNIELLYIDSHKPYYCITKEFTAPTRKRETLIKTWKFSGNDHHLEIALNVMDHMCNKIIANQKTHRKEENYGQTNPC